MKVRMITSLVYIDSNLKPIFLDQHKTYNVPDSWGRLFLQNEIGAELIKIANKNQSEVLPLK